MKRVTCLFAITLMLVVSAFADVPRPQPTKAPKQTKSIATNLYIRLDPDAKEARLLIPKDQIQQLRAQLDALDNGTGTVATTAGGFSRIQTIVSGLFLSLAFVFGGIWFVRSGRAATRVGKGLVASAVVAGIASAATFVYANAGPPPEARSITGKMFTQAVHSYRFGSGAIKLEVSDEEGVYLIVPDPQDKPNGDE